MELRYLGFEQSQNARSYKFDGVEGRTTRHFVVTTDLRLFRDFNVAIQEGPSLCARKLAEDISANSEGMHELTTEDLRGYVERRSGAAALKPRHIHRRLPHRKPSPGATQSPWRAGQPQQT